MSIFYSNQFVNKRQDQKFETTATTNITIESRSCDVFKCSLNIFYSLIVDVSCLGGEVLKNSLSVDKFLGQESGGGKHSKTSVLEFLCLQKLEFFLVLGFESKRIEADVTRDVVGTEKTRLVDRGVLGLDPSDGGTLLLTGTNSNGQKQPERNRDLGKVGDGRSRNLGIEKEGASLNGFTGKESNGGEHCCSIRKKSYVR